MDLGILVGSIGAFNLKAVLLGAMAKTDLTSPWLTWDITLTLEKPLPVRLVYHNPL